MGNNFWDQWIKIVEVVEFPVFNSGLAANVEADILYIKGSPKIMKFSRNKVDIQGFPLIYNL